MKILNKALLPVFITGILFSTGYSATFIQKIGLSISTNSPYYSKEVLIKKTVLAEAGKNNSVYLFSDEKEELEQYKIKELNGSVFIRIVPVDKSFQIELLEINQMTTNKWETSSVFKEEQFLSKINGMADGIVKKIATRYPPKEKQELKTVEVSTESLSPFEKSKPTLSVKILPYMAYRNSTLSMGVSVTNDLSRMYNLNPGPLNEFYFGLIPEIEFEWRWFHANLQAGITLNDLFIMPTMGIGMFGNLVVLGFGANVHIGSYRSRESDFTFNFKEDSVMVTNTALLKEPDVGFGALLFIGYTKLNLTKQFSITLRGGGIIGGGGSVFHNSLTNAQSVSYDGGTSGYHFEGILDFEINEKSRWYLRYMSSEYRFETDYKGIYKQKPPVIGNISYTNNLSATRTTELLFAGLKSVQSLIGVGYVYEF